MLAPAVPARRHLQPPFVRIPWRLVANRQLLSKQSSWRTAARRRLNRSSFSASVTPKSMLGRHADRDIHRDFQSPAHAVPSRSSRNISAFSASVGGPYNNAPTESGEGIPTGCAVGDGGSTTSPLPAS